MINAGSIRGAFESTPMKLTFSAQIWRATITVTPLGSKEESYAKHGGVLPCDVVPLSDALRMAQVGQTEVISHVVHFFENTDVLVRDIVQITSNIRLGSATIPNYFYIMEVLQPSESMFGFIRCRVRAGLDPTQVP